jgi:glycine betaine/proline transport system substrate-binding protein
MLRAAVIAVFSFCAAASSPADAAECGRVRIAEMSWGSAAIIANVEKIILERGYGCDVELVAGDTVPTLTSMAERGEPDIAPELWINAAKDVIARGVADNRLKVAAKVLSDGGIEGWYVPRHMVEKNPDLTSLSAVLKRPDLFPDPETQGKGRFYTCPAGWACQIVNDNLFKAYGLDKAGFTPFDPGSGEGLAGAIAKANERSEPFFGYYFGPTAILGRYPMQRLTGMEHDPATWECMSKPNCAKPTPNMYPPADVIGLTSARFVETNPEVFAVLRNVSWKNSEVSALLAWQEDTRANAAEAAEHFIATQENIWTPWVSDDAAEKVKSGTARWYSDFPALEPKQLRDLERRIDEAYRAFTRAYGPGLERMFSPLLALLVVIENALLTAPWWIVFASLIALVYNSGRNWKLALGVAIAFYAIGWLGMWDDTMRTLAIISVATLIAIALGIPIGIWMARSKRVQAIVTPLLDVMQTLPIFVYLIPVVMLLGLGKVPGLIAVVIYAIPPVIRLTDLGLRLVDRDVLEAADAFGATWRQRLLGVQLPLALPNVMAGINQTIMLALSMVVIASMIGVRGLGQPVLRAVTNQYFAVGLFYGAAVVALAIMFDRTFQAYGRRIQARKSS